MEETGLPGENHRPVASHWQTLLHNVVRVHQEVMNNMLRQYIWKYTNMKNDTNETKAIPVDKSMVHNMVIIKWTFCLEEPDT